MPLNNQQRMDIKMKKISFFTAAIALVLALTMLSGCSFPGIGAEELDFSGAGLTITLTVDFYEKNHVSFTGCYESQEMLVLTLKEEFTILEEIDFSKDSTVEDYLELVISANEHSAKIAEKDGIPYFTYESSAAGKDFKYMATAVKSSDAFWLVQFAVHKEDFNKYEDTMFKYAASIKVD